MSRFDKLLLKLLRGTSDASFTFDELRYILTRLGFEERIHGSHHVFRKADVAEHVVIQPDGKDVKPYLVRRVREVILRYGLGGEDDGQV